MISRNAPKGSGPVVYVDASPFSWGKLTGISRYAARLSLALRERADVRFFCEEGRLALRDDVGWGLDQDLEKWCRSVWKSRRVPLEEPPRSAIALYCATRPRTRRFPVELSILHDFTPLILPHTHREQTRSLFMEFYSQTLPLSDRAIAVSRSTKADACVFSSMPPDRIDVALSGPSLCLERHLCDRPAKRLANVGLVVSTLEPRKNARFLFDWFHESKALPDVAELWWVGPAGWLTSGREIRRLAKRPGGRKIRLLGMVSDQRLCELYQTAGWSVYPSLYEGFGFPVLDSLRHGTPVLLSRNSSLEEFEGLGVHFFDPCDPTTVDLAWKSFTTGAEPLAEPAELDRRFDWRKVAEAVLASASGESSVLTVAA